MGHVPLNWAYLHTDSSPFFAELEGMSACPAMAMWLILCCWWKGRDRTSHGRIPERHALGEKAVGKSRRRHLCRLSTLIGTKWADTTMHLPDERESGELQHLTPPLPPNHEALHVKTSYLHGSKEQDAYFSCFGDNEKSTLLCYTRSTVEVFYGGLQVNLLLPLSPLQCQSVQLSKNL